jgi:hypothetical protein
MKQLAAIAILGLWSGVAQAQTCIPPAPACAIQAPVTVPLLAQGTIPVGTVTVSNDKTNLYVTFATIPDWTITRADVAFSKTLAGLPQKNGQPDIKTFPYSKTFCPGATCVIFTIPLGTINQGDTLFIAAHASVDSPTQGHKQAWAAGTLFPGSAACKPGGGCGDGHSGSGMGASNGGGECDDSATRPKNLINNGGGSDDDGDDDGDSCSGSGGGDSHHGDAVIIINNGGGDDHGGGQKCGGSGGGEHGDSSRGHVQNGGDGGGGDDHHGDGDKSKGDCKSSQCGATYFTYVANCITIIE